MYIATSKNILQDAIAEFKNNNAVTCTAKDVKQKKRRESRKEEILEFISTLKWFNIVLLTTIHVIFVIDLFTYPWNENRGLVFFTFVVAMISATGLVAGTHRLWTHRSYKAKLPLRIALMLAYSMTGHNPIYDWVRDHRVHHKYTDTDADPHNSKRGFFFSHIGWLMVKKHPEVIRRGKEVDMSDVLADPVIRFHQKYYLPLVLGLGFILPALIPPLLWGQGWYWSILNSFVDRYCIVLNITWSINSVSHIWGYKPFNIRIRPTDGYRLAHLTFGEGWHNFHHTFPWSYRFGHYGGFPADFAAGWIDIFAKMGLAYDLKIPTSALIKKAAERYGDGSFPDWKYLEIPESAEQEICESTDKNNNNRSKLHLQELM